MYRRGPLEYSSSYQRDRNPENGLDMALFTPKGRCASQERSKAARNPFRQFISIIESICGLCSKIFLKEDLLAHMVEVHEKRRDFRCPTCGKDFRQRTSLNNHVRTVHNKIKDYQCLICQKTFGQKTTLSNHIKNVHEKRKDQLCPICHRSFGQLTTLNNHIKSIHEKIRAYGCVYCLKTFGQKANLQTHIKNVHAK
ncbi:Uncharacterized protein FKW44_021877 [Caligus rogercresseyi]|uniref:C2H2-type domain-containing protein n=1 Tax=Caligus rogercresseyi TaxID=217165 RepID=A0A7T8GRY1_CALRO|nr:Uncharacterized protein FKW44_021877 [Caligus rogercresseyi]